MRKNPYGSGVSGPHGLRACACREHGAIIDSRAASGAQRLISPAVLESGTRRSSRAASLTAGYCTARVLPSGYRRHCARRGISGPGGQALVTAVRATVTRGRWAARIGDKSNCPARTGDSDASGGCGAGLPTRHACGYPFSTVQVAPQAPIRIHLSRYCREFVPDPPASRPRRRDMRCSSGTAIR